MFYKIKGFILLILIILLQSCSGGRLGDFLESSFDNLEKKTDKKSQKVLEKQIDVYREKKGRNERKNKEIKPEENPKKVLEKQRAINKEKKGRNKRNNKEIKPEENLQKF